MITPDNLFDKHRLAKAITGVTFKDGIKTTKTGQIAA
jgi:hypothetical protein